MRIAMIAATAVLASACASGPASAPSVGAPSPASGEPEASTPSRPPAAAGLKPASAWTTDSAAIAMLKEEEALRTTAYQVSGQWLIGYGHSEDVKAGMTITRTQAEQF